LIVQSTRKAGGVRLTPDHPQYAEYVEAFETAIDVIEADSLCKALIN
jgi:maltose-binding protein MalE